ncbi:ASST-domain-containing protein [Pseudomassariella vexata]|uniref:ASST-domain-containing protein n=1 Tax=Pseudomassariella vexata TaxID=1141098 RepID=A0A1Y2D8T9_9PEZI|nr:ASST-domain-containing protein [Pseudomassariella vexata]ORY55678.1 ASST-domain-containing protein [Pseudomassariella vexata]
MHLPSSLVFSLVCSLASVSVNAQTDETWPYQTFKSEPSLQPPSLEITKSGPTAPGYIFFDQNGQLGHNYSLFIMTDENELVWQGELGDLTGFKTQTLDGKPVLTYYTGATFSEPLGFGYGVVEILDDSYEHLYTVTINGTTENWVALGGANLTFLDEYQWYLDMHEALITPEGTLLVTANNVSQIDLTSVGGPADGWIIDSLFYEIDIKTNEILFRWSHLAHLDQIPLTDVLSVYPLDDLGQNQTVPWGPFHINSVEKFADGSYLIDSRHYCAFFKIAKDGSVEWTLQGRTGGDFTLGTDLSFCYQHDARIHAEDGNKLLISIYNNDNSGTVSGVNQTSGLFISVNTDSFVANMTQEFIDPNEAIYSKSQGNMQVLENKNVLMGYGSTPKFKEFNANGSVVMDARFGYVEYSVFSYRIFRQEWVGNPKTAPKVFACKDTATNQTEVYMSWNGATEHQSWNVYASATEENLSLAATVAKSGFETVAKIGGWAEYVSVEALGLNTTSKMSTVVSALTEC